MGLAFCTTISLEADMYEQKRVLVVGGRQSSVRVWEGEFRKEFSNSKFILSPSVSDAVSIIRSNEIFDIVILTGALDERVSAFVDTTLANRNYDLRKVLISLADIDLNNQLGEMGCVIVDASNNDSLIALMIGKMKNLEELAA